jgi:glycosyltransferase involved in cell wall biosynthesis
MKKLGGLMKIVHIMSWYIPNMGYQENFLPLEQKKRGHNVVIITSDRYPLYKGMNEKTRFLKSGIYNDKGITIYRLPCFFEIIEGGQIILMGIKRIIKKIKPDIVHSHGAFTTVTIQAIHHQKQFKYKLFIDDHSHSFKTNFKIDNFLKKMYVYFVKNYYNSCRKRIKCLLPVNQTSEQILNIYFPNFDMELLHLGANNDLFKPSKNLRIKIREKYNIKENEILLITSGKFDRNKDIDVLIHSFNNLKEDRRYKLFIVGNGQKEYMNYLRTLSNDSMNKKIFFIDFLKNDKLNQYYNAADIGVWPGDPSIGVIEAISSGLPVIIPGNDIVYNLLLENKSAITFKRKNIRSLIKSIYKLSNRDERDEIQKNGLLLISQKLSWVNIAKTSINYYKIY